MKKLLRINKTSETPLRASRAAPQSQKDPHLKTSDSSSFAGANTRGDADWALGRSRELGFPSWSLRSIPDRTRQASSSVAEGPRPYTREQELVTWICVAVIAVLSAIAFYILWIRTARGF